MLSAKTETLLSLNDIYSHNTPVDQTFLTQRWTAFKPTQETMKNLEAVHQDITQRGYCSATDPDAKHITKRVSLAYGLPSIRPKEIANTVMQILNEQISSPLHHANNKQVSAKKQRLLEGIVLA